MYKLYENGDLRELIYDKQRLSETEVVGILKDLVKALKLLKDSLIVHRCISPENIFLAFDHAVLGDLGHIFILENEDEVVTDPISASEYTAPEILENKLYGLQSDVYSLGVKDI